MDSLRCEKCNHLMILQRSSDTDFVRYSSRYHYKCTKRYCSNYCVRKFDHKITMFHELNKKLIGMKEHLIQPIQPNPIKETIMEENKDPEIINAENNYGQIQSRVIMRGGHAQNGDPNNLERIKITIEYDINSYVRLTPGDIELALKEMYEQIDIVEDTNVPGTLKTEISNINCEVWTRIIN